MPPPIRILLLADSHLGFDLPARPRVRRRRRGHDFQANHEAALDRALAGDIDVVVHGGDLFHRPRVAPALAWQGLAPLARVAEAGIPVALVPGNHERSRIPHAHLARHPGLHVFDRPRTLELEVRGTPLRLVGFPFERRVRARFPGLLRQAGWRPGRPGLDLLCLHQCVEGATVGPSDFTFTTGDDVVRGRDIPAGLAAVLSGHIHRHQVLTRDLAGEPLAAPVLYPGSVERTSLAERDEAKGYLVVELDPAGAAPPRWRFHPLPARPMRVAELDLEGLDAPTLRSALRAILDAAPSDAVLRIRTRGRPADDDARSLLRAESLRALTPPGMNLELRDADGRFERRRPAPAGTLQTTLGL